MRVAVFGKPGGGKSTLSRQIAAVARLPLHSLDLLQFAEGGARVADAVFAQRHAELLAQPDWVIDGFGTPKTFEDLLHAADVLVYVDRPAVIHYWWVTKRFILSPFIKPLGWPAHSPLLRSTLSSYRYLRLSSRFWTTAFRARLHGMQPSKRVYVIERSADVRTALGELAHAR